MLLICCPWCGDREEDEFSYGGQAFVTHPSEPEALNDAEWAAFLFTRDNPKGEWSERWCHTAGCRRWFVAVRDTETQRFVRTAPLGRPSTVHAHAQ